MTLDLADYGVLGVVGVGALGRAVVTGLCEGIVDPPRILLSPRGAAVSAELAGRFPSVGVAPDNQAVVAGSDLVLVCLRTADAALLGELAWRPGHIVVSAVAGLGIPELTTLVAPATSSPARCRCHPSRTGPG